MCIQMYSSGTTVCFDFRQWNTVQDKKNAKIARNQIGNLWERPPLRLKKILGGNRALRKQSVHQTFLRLFLCSGENILS